MIYITTTSDLLKNQKLFTSLQKDDALYILYTENNASIPIEAYGVLSSLKCSVDFQQFPRTLDEQFSFVFEMGKKCGSNNNSTIRGITDTKDEAIRSLIKSLDKKTQKTTARKRQTQSKETTEKPFMPLPEAAEPAAEVKSAPVEEPQKPKRGRKKKTDDNFDKAYDDLMALFASVKTKSFDPTNQVYGIVKAVKMTITEGTDLKESFKVWFPNGTDKYIKAFAGREDELIKIVQNLNDEDAK